MHSAFVLRQNLISVERPVGWRAEAFVTSDSALKAVSVGEPVWQPAGRLRSVEVGRATSSLVRLRSPSALEQACARSGQGRSPDADVCVRL